MKIVSNKKLKIISSEVLLNYINKMTNFIFQNLKKLRSI